MFRPIKTGVSSFFIHSNYYLYGFCFTVLTVFTALVALAPSCRHIIIDTDPGQDDAVAILLALASPELNVLGITAVAGNVPLDLTTRNICKILELADRADIPV